jgi:transposase-like protein
MTMPTTIRCPLCEKSTLVYRKPVVGGSMARWDCPGCGARLGIILLASLKHCGSLVMLRKFINSEAARRANNFRDILGRNG